MLSHPLWIVLAATVAIAVAWWWYGRREEDVPGRRAAGVLRAGALFLILASPALPGGRSTDPPGPGGGAALVDLSRSMELPVAPGGGTRLDSALRLAGSVDPELRFRFGDSTGRLEADARPRDAASRLTEALIAAAAAGADSALAFTDGTLDDPEEARATAERLGIGLREVPVAAPTGRVAIAELRAVGRVAAGDTLRVEVELASGGGGALPDSVEVHIAADGDAWTAAAAVPAPGRRGRVEIPVVLEGAEGWRVLEATLRGAADPLRPEARARAWIEVRAGDRGVVALGVDPDWELRWMMPVLRRALPGPARAFVRPDAERWLSVGAEPEQADGEAVRSAVAGSGVLVVQGVPGDLPGWIADAAEAHPRLLFLVTGPGPIGRSEAVAGPPADGEWFAVAPASGPLAAWLPAPLPEDLPPLAPFHPVLGGPDGGVGLTVRRRDGESRPALRLLRLDGRRVAVMAAGGSWRWAARGDRPRQLHRGLWGGTLAWLAADAPPPPVRLEPSRPRAGIPLGWRVAPGVADLVIAVRDSSGRTVWSDSLSAPDRRVRGPIPEAGDASFEAIGRGPDGPFRVERPFVVAVAAELLPGPGRDPIVVPPAEAGRGDSRPGGPRPLWPFPLAALLLAAEWAWRRRAGLP